MKLSLKITHSTQSNCSYRIPYSVPFRLNIWTKNRLVRNTTGKPFKTFISSSGQSSLSSAQFNSPLFTPQLNIYRPYSRSNYTYSKPCVIKSLVFSPQFLNSKSYFFVTLFIYYSNWTKNMSMLQFSVLTLLKLNITKAKLYSWNPKRRVLGQASTIISNRLHLL